jgi:hypothetical protein
MPREATTLASVKRKDSLTKRQQVDIRAGVQARYTSKVVNRLAKQALGQLKDRNGERIDMSMAEIRAAEIMLKKTLPDLSSMQIVESDSVESMSRAEIESMLSSLLRSNPLLAKIGADATRGQTEEDVDIPISYRLINGDEQSDDDSDSEQSENLNEDTD